METGHHTTSLAGSVEELLAPLGPCSTQRFRMADGYSGNALEWVSTLDGQRFVLKRMRIDEDWIMTSTHDVECRAVAVWRAGFLHRMPPGIEHAVVGCARDGEGFAVLMRDVSPWMLPPSGTVSRADWTRILRHAAAIHATFLEEQQASFGCSLEDRYALLGPSPRARAAREGSSAPPVIDSGWDVFGEVVPADVSEPVLSLAADPAPLAGALRLSRQTFLHGDLKFGNLGSWDSATVMLDWQWCGFGPPATDLAWFVALNATRCEGSRDEIVECFGNVLAEALGARFHREEWARSRDLALLGGLVQLGWNKAWDSVHSERPEDRRREASDLAWWVPRARAGVERLS